MRNIPYSRQDISEGDIEAMADILRSDFLTTGPTVGKFEDSVKDFCKAKHAVALSNGTAALHICMLALNVGKGDIVWTSPMSFVASANCALYVGATVDFVDCNLQTGNMDIVALGEKLEDAEKNNRLPKAVVVVHFSGRVCAMEEIHALSKKYNFAIVEDSAHALGAYYKDGTPVGSGKYSDITTFSFHPVKAIATGEGGMCATNNDSLAERMRIFLSHGITRNPDLMENKPHGPWYYEQRELGFNYRITDIQCALGVSQMSRLQEFINSRLRLAKNYNEALQGLSLILPEIDENSGWHLYVIQLDDNAKISRLELFEKLRSFGIGVNVHYIPIHTQPYYEKLGFASGDFPNAEKFYSRAISIPLFPTLKQEEQNYVIEKLKEFLA